LGVGWEGEGVKVWAQRRVQKGWIEKGLRFARGTKKVKFKV